MKAAYRGKGSKNGRLRRVYGILCPVPLFLIDGDRRDCPLRKVGMTTLQPLDMIKMDNKPVSRYNVYMRSSTSPLFSLSRRAALACAILEFLLCIISPTPKATFFATFRRGPCAESLAVRSFSPGQGPTISMTSIWCLQSLFCKGLVGTFSPLDNHLSPLALEDSPSMTFI